MSDITIRRGGPRDAEALSRLAALDSSRPPAGDVLVVEVENELRAALSLHGGRVIADPFHETAELVWLLQARARQLRAEREPPRRRRRVLRPAPRSA